MGFAPEFMEIKEQSINPQRHLPPTKGIYFKIIYFSIVTFEHYLTFRLEYKVDDDKNK